VKIASSSAIGGHQNVGTRANGTGWDGRILGYSGCLGGDDELPSPAGGDFMVTLDGTVCSGGVASGCLGPGGWRMVTPGDG